MTITEKIIKMNDKYDEYLEYKNRMSDIKIESFEKTFNDILHIIHKLEYIIKNSQLDEWSDSFKSNILSLTRDLWNKFVEYQSMIENFNRKLYSSYLLFEKIKNNLDENEKKQFLSLETIIDNIMKYSNELNAELINNKELFAYVDENTNNNGYEVNLSNIQGSIEYSKYIKDFFERISKMISPDNSKKDSRNVMLSKYEKVSLQDGIALIDDTPLKEQETLVDLPFEGEISVDDFVMVHATNFFPKKHEIKSNRGGEKKYTKEINGQNMELQNARDTVHFSINGKVSSHDGGNWDKMKYIIVEPLSEHIKQFESFRVVDSWIRGNVKLSDRAILMVKDDAYDNLTEEQKKEYDIIIFRGDSEICVQKLLIMLGYKPQTIAAQTWGNIYGPTVEKFMKNHYSLNTSTHYGSNELNAEHTVEKRDMILSANRGEPVDSFDGMQISKKEVLLLFSNFLIERQRIYGSIEMILETFKLFISKYGIRLYGENYYAISISGILTTKISEQEEEIIIDAFLDDLNNLYRIDRKNLLNYVEQMYSLDNSMEEQKLSR